MRTGSIDIQWHLIAQLLSLETRFFDWRKCCSFTNEDLQVVFVSWSDPWVTKLTQLLVVWKRVCRSERNFLFKTTTHSCSLYCMSLNYHCIGRRVDFEGSIKTWSRENSHSSKVQQICDSDTTERNHFLEGSSFFFRSLLSPPTIKILWCKFTHNKHRISPATTTALFTTVITNKHVRPL